MKLIPTLSQLVSKGIIICPHSINDDCVVNDSGELHINVLNNSTVGSVETAMSAYFPNGTSDHKLFDKVGMQSITAFSSMEDIVDLLNSAACKNLNIVADDQDIYFCEDF